MTKLPSVTIGSTLNATAVQKPVSAPYNRRAKQYSNHVVAAASSGLQNRTPNSLAPNSAVLA